jgi:hypothetical protein
MILEPIIVYQGLLEIQRIHIQRENPTRICIYDSNSKTDLGWLGCQ